MDIHSLEPVIPFVKDLSNNGLVLRENIKPFSKFSNPVDIIEHLDRFLVLSFNDTVNKRLNTALFTFYRGLFPIAIQAILRIEDLPNVVAVDLDNDKHLENLNEEDDYRESLIKEFFQKMDGQTGPAIDYIARQIAISKMEDGKLAIAVDDLVTDIKNNRKRLLELEVSRSNSAVGHLHWLCGVPQAETFAEINYREQIIDHVSLVWRLYLIYFVVYRKEGLFTIPYNKQYGFRYFENRTTSETKVSLIVGELTEDSFTEWSSIRPQDKIVPIGATFKDIVDKVGCRRLEGA